MCSKSHGLYATCSKSPPSVCTKMDVDELKLRLRNEWASELCCLWNGVVVPAFPKVVLAHFTLSGIYAVLLNVCCKICLPVFIEIGSFLRDTGKNSWHVSFWDTVCNVIFQVIPRLRVDCQSHTEVMIVDGQGSAIRSFHDMMRQSTHGVYCTGNLMSECDIETDCAESYFSRFCCNISKKQY